MHSCGLRKVLHEGYVYSGHELNWPANFGWIHDAAVQKVQGGWQEQCSGVCWLYGNSKIMYQIGRSLSVQSGNGKQYCMSGRTIINNAACAIPAAVQTMSA